MAIKPKLAMIPSGYKGGASKGDLYSVLPSDGVGDFDFSRSGSATRINKDGLIETVSSNVPRLNYPLIDGVVSGCPSLLLEPERRNLITYSEDFLNDYWIKANTIISPNNAISPNGTLNADLISDTNGGSLEYVVSSQNFTNQNVDISTSLFLKKGTQRYVALRLFGIANQKYYTIIVDLENGVITKSQFGSSTTNASYGIKNFGNGWYNITLKANNNSTSNSFSMMFCDKSSTIGSFGQINFVGSGNNNFYSWGAQVEESSFSTSYIPNYGTSLGVTRSAETCNNAGDVNTFNDSEGVLMAEVSTFADNTYKRISLNNGSFVNSVLFDFIDDNNLYGKIFVGGSPIATILASGLNIENNNKLALKYKQNDFALWVNGIQVGVATSGSTPSELNKLSLDLGGNQDFYGNTKQIQYFDTALTDTDLEELTSWKSFNEMAQSQLYSVY